MTRLKCESREEVWYFRLVLSIRMLAKALCKISSGSPSCAFTGMVKSTARQILPAKLVTRLSDLEYTFEARLIMTIIPLGYSPSTLLPAIISQLDRFTAHSRISGCSLVFLYQMPTRHVFPENYRCVWLVGFWFNWVRDSSPSLCTGSEWRSGNQSENLLVTVRKKWGEWWDLNPRMAESQSAALTTSPHPPQVG